jgi:polyhydroxybutyrate depolymerase
MRSAVLVLLAGCSPYDLLPAVADPCATWEAPGLYRYETEVKGDTRKAYVFVPSSEGPRDLAVVLHGGTMTAESIAEATQYIPLAIELDFVAVFPRGKEVAFLPGWNAGECCGALDDEHRAIEDVAFLDQLVDELRDRVCGDRVLATGFSNGAMMSHRWACESDRVDVAVPASGPLMIAAKDCVGDPVPLRHYHGTTDLKVPVDGDEDFNSVDFTMDTWRERNGCDTSEPTVTVDDRLTCTAWSCRVPTEQCLVDGLGHQWAGGVNAASLGVDATAEGFAFFLEQGATSLGTAPTE